MKKVIYILIIFSTLISNTVVYSQQRFPKPEFETGYTQPSPETPEPISAVFEYIDLFVLLAVLSLASWLAVRKRSRRGIIWLSVFSLLYFGFYREGCICPVGSIQNVALTFFDPAYKISLYVLLFFLLPLVFALFFGRTFCAAACPLGAIQDLLILKPVSSPAWINKTLGFIPYIYLSLAILFAATGTDFLICRYDPFVGFFRRDAHFMMIVLGISILVIGMFYARPYCRIFCPYGVLLNLFSGFSKWHLSITPAECVQCKLCVDSCPFDAIDFPTEDKELEARSNPSNLKRFLLFALLIPVWILIGGYTGSQAHIYLSKANREVNLAELLITRPELKADLKNLDIQAFLESGKTMDDLVKSAEIIRAKFYKGGWLMGGFLGLVLGSMLMNQMIFRRRTDYVANRNNCFSCGRCMDYCPVGKEIKL